MPRFADSSPQGGRDWFLSASYSVASSDIGNVAAATDQLQDSAPALTATMSGFDEAGELAASSYEVVTKRWLMLSNDLGRWFGRVT